MADPTLITEPPADLNTPPADPPPADPPPADPTPEEQKVIDDKAAEDKAAADKLEAEKNLTPEQKKEAEEKAAADKKAEEEKAELHGAPEGDYETFELPEGIEMDDAMLEKFVPLAKELDLSQKGAQKLVDLRNDTVQAEADRQWDVWNTAQDEAVETSKNDKEIGGEKFQENLGIAKKAMDAYGSGALKDLADATGVGNNVEFIRFLVKIGNDLGEDKLRVSSSSGNVEADRGKRIFNNTK